MIKHHFGAGVYIREARLLRGEKVVKHIHSYDHLSILGEGTVIVETDGVSKMYTAPSCILVKKGIEHKVTAITDSTWFCVHSSESEEVDDKDSVIIRRN